MCEQDRAWWRLVRSYVRKFPNYQSRGMSLSRVEKMNYSAVKAAVEATKSMADGEDRLKVIRLLHWDRTHNLDGAAIKAHCSPRAAAYWQREFFKEVARNRDLLD